MTFLAEIRIPDFFCLLETLQQLISKFFQANRQDWDFWRVRNGHSLAIKLNPTLGRGTSSKAFQVEEYMEKVEMWFRKYEMSHNKTKRQIYLATDEVKVEL